MPPSGRRPRRRRRAANEGDPCKRRPKGSRNDDDRKHSTLSGSGGSPDEARPPAHGRARGRRSSPRVSHAQDLEPRSYANTPIGLNFLIAGYAYQTGDVATDPSLPLEDAKVHIHSAVLAYARSFNLFGTSAKADVIVPYSWLEGSALFRGMPENRKVDGFADPRFRLSVNLYGAPALTLDEFAAYEQNVIVGVSVQVAAPLGQYDDARAVNIGSHRWVFKPELGISKAFGPLILEVAPSIAVFTANDDFLGGKRREQDPIYAVQGHAIYRFGDALWGSVDGTYYGGGRTTIDGVEGDDRQSNARIGATLVALGQPPSFDQALRQQVRRYPRRGRLRPDRHGAPIPLGRRPLTKRADSGRTLAAAAHGRRSAVPARPEHETALGSERHLAISWGFSTEIATASV